MVLIALLAACIDAECPPVEPGPIPDGTFPTTSYGDLPPGVQTVTVLADRVVLTVEGEDGPYEVVYRRGGAE